MINHRLPAHFKQDIPGSSALKNLRLLVESKVNTVCVAAKCPNLSRCFGRGEFTFSILGDACTRHCAFCALNGAQRRDKQKNDNLCVDAEEVERITRIVKLLGLGYVVITSVTRDDLADAGAGQFARVLNAIHCLDDQIKIEVLIPDFSGDILALNTVIEAGPVIIAHNLETVRRLYKIIKPDSDYPRSLRVLEKIRQINPAIITKSSLILGLGESEDEVIQAMQDLSLAGVSILTLGQYLCPGKNYYPVQEFISEEQFARYGQLGRALGFKSVLSAPVMRSSYRAQELYKEVTEVTEVTKVTEVACA